MTGKCQSLPPWAQGKTLLQHPFLKAFPFHKKMTPFPLSVKCSSSSTNVYIALHLLLKLLLHHEFPVHFSYLIQTLKSLFKRTIRILRFTRAKLSFPQFLSCCKRKPHGEKFSHMKIQSISSSNSSQTLLLSSQQAAKIRIQICQDIELPLRTLKYVSKLNKVPFCMSPAVHKIHVCFVSVQKYLKI